MKIDDSINGVSGIRNRDTRKLKRDGNPETSSASNASDSVEITQTSARLSQLESDMSQIASSDAGKVEAVRQAIADGSFHVDEEAVADALVQTTIDQLRRSGPRN